MDVSPQNYNTAKSEISSKAPLLDCFGALLLNDTVRVKREHTHMTGTRGTGFTHTYTLGSGAPDSYQAEIVRFGCFIRYFCTLLVF